MLESLRLHDNPSLRLLYATADLFSSPPRQDNITNTVLEAYASGIPVIAYATGGLLAILEDRRSGTLAQLFDPLSLVTAIRWVLEDSQRRPPFEFASRRCADHLWSS